MEYSNRQNMCIECISWFWLFNFGCSDKGIWLEVWGSLFCDLSIQCWFMREIEDPVYKNSARTKIFWCNVCYRIFGMVSMMDFMFEGIGLTCMRLFIILFRSTYGFVDGLSWLIGYMFHVAWCGFWKPTWELIYLVGVDT